MVLFSTWRSSWKELTSCQYRVFLSIDIEYCPIYLVTLISFIRIVWFSICRSCTYFIRLTPRYFILENANLSGPLHGSQPYKFSFQSERRAMPKNVQTTVQLHSFHKLARLYLKALKLGFSSMLTKNFQMYTLV